jgi:iron only hydrogenase large subunit-like protein
MSAILSADDLNDFISPGVACIKPVETLPKQEDYNPYEVTTEDKVQPQNPAPASISLTDCLACSGCVTSAEAVLVSLQSHTEVLNTLDSHPEINVRQVLESRSNEVNASNAIPEDARIFVASVSPQVRASIAATYGITERAAGHLIEQFLSGSQGLRIGGQNKSAFHYVIDTNRLREACLVLGAEEMQAALDEKSKTRPVITSACPGWICYAEKTHPHVLPHLSTLKSPQALSGTLIKSILSEALGVAPSQIWHLALMPCFDKKLEASREELTDAWWHSTGFTATPTRDVDCVITSRELLSLATARNIQLASLPLKPLADPVTFPDPTISDFLSARTTTSSSFLQNSTAGSSGGYLYHILLSQQARHPGSTISTTRGRNADVVEYSLMSPTSDRPIFKAARYYGFRNIQNLVRKLKPAKQSRLPGAVRKTAMNGISKDDYAYVEVMACPGGCTNGGGQIKVDDVADILAQTRGEVVDKATSTTPPAQKEWLKRVDEAYYSMSDSEDESAAAATTSPHAANGHVNGNGTADLDTEKMPGPVASTVNGIDVPHVKYILRHWADTVGIPLEKLAYTNFRAVESDVGKKKAKDFSDTERIASIAGLSGGGW